MASEDEADALYGLELSEFTPARTELVKRLKADGERDRAAEVGKLRKPTVAAWVANRVARDAPKDVAALLAAGAALREVQLGGGAASDVREATEAEQEALRVVMRTAGTVAKAADAAGDTLQRVHDTLHAAALDDELGDQLRRGVLVREQQSAGGFLLGGVSLAPAPARKATAASKPRVKGSARAARKAEAEPRPTAAAVKRLERARAAAGEAQTMLEEAQEQAGDAEDELSQAEAALAGAREELAAAERRVERAERQVKRTQANVDHAGERAAKALAALEALG